MMWITIRIILLGFERIFGKILTKNSSPIISAWGFFGFSTLMFLPFINYLNFDIIKVSLISGTIYSFSFFLYMYALSKEDVSVVAPLYNINAIFLIFISFLFLSEKITIQKIVGSILMIYGVSYLKKEKSISGSYKNILKSKGALAMIISSLLMAIGRVVDGFLTTSFNKLGYSLGVYLIITIYFFTVSLLSHKNVKVHIDYTKKNIIYLLLGGFCNAYAYFALLMAFKYMDVSIAEPVSMISALVSVIFSYIFFKEKIKVRIFGTILLISGAFVIYL